MEPFETFEHAGMTCRLYQDYDAGNPFTEWDQASELLSDVKGYDLGGDVPHPESAYADTPASATMARWLTLFGGYALAIPWTFQDYGSSGARTWLTTPDDDPADGWLVLTREAFEREFGAYGMPLRIEDESEERSAERTIRAEFDAFRAWVEGEVIGYVVEDENGEHVDSCWGFYGEPEHVRQEARSAAEHEAHERWLEVEPPDVAEVLAVA